MTELAPIGKKPLGAWQVQTLRLTAFAVKSIPLEDHGWWSSIMNEPPITTTKNLRENLYVETGSSRGSNLTNRIRPDRVDWILSLSGSELMTTGFTFIGPITEELAPFVTLMEEWLGKETCPQLRRIAFGASLLMPVQGKDEGYMQLPAYLPSVQIDPQSSDFLYRINRPRTSQLDVAGLVLNRLSAWSIQYIQMLTLSPEPATPVRYADRGDFYACRLELDVSSTAYRVDPLPQACLPDLFRELTNLGKEIAEEGDIP